MPLVQVGDRVPEVLEGQHVYVRQGRFDDFHRKRRVRLVAIAQDQVMGVMPTNGIVRSLVVLAGQVG